MKKHRFFLTSLLILLLLAGGLTYRNVNIKVLDSMENPTWAPASRFAAPLSCSLILSGNFRPVIR